MSTDSTAPSPSGWRAIPRGKLVGLLICIVALGISAIAFQIYGNEIFAWMRLQIYLLKIDHYETPFWFNAGFVIAIILTRALFLPITVPIILAAGIFYPDVATALLVTVLSATVGDFLAFLLARHYFRDAVEQSCGAYLGRINKGLRDNGLFYVVLLKLLPIFPGPVVNFGLALTVLPNRIFLLASIISKLPLFLLYVIMGREMLQMKSLSDIFTLQTILFIGGLCGLALLGKMLADVMRKKRVLTKREQTREKKTLEPLG